MLRCAFDTMRSVQQLEKLLLVLIQPQSASQQVPFYSYCLSIYVYILGLCTPCVSINLVCTGVYIIYTGTYKNKQKYQ